MIETSLKDIVEYWSDREDERSLSVDWAEAEERCWRCGYKSKLQRCHIIPDSLEGVDHPSNLVLLCFRCHREAPNHSNPKYMWIWIKNTGDKFYDSYWTQKGMEEFEKMFKRKPFSNLDASKIKSNEIANLIENEMQKTIIHYGEGRLNPSTIACIISEIEEKLTNNYTNAR